MKASFRVCALIALSSVALIACNSNKTVGKDNVALPTPLAEFEGKTNFDRLWKSSVDTEDSERGERLQPAVGGERVFVAGVNIIRAIQVQSGKAQWSSKAEGRWSAGPATDGKRVVVGSLDGDVAAFDVSDGELLWSAKVSSEVLAAPAVSGSTVVVKTIDGRVHAFNAQDGKALWQVARDVPLLTLRGSSAPILTDDQVFIASENGKVVALRLTDGAPVWEQTISTSSGRNELQRVSDIDGQIALDNGDLFVAGYNGQSAAVASDSGQSFWSVDVPSVTGLALSDKLVIVTDTDSEIVALDRRSGGELWRQKQLKHRMASAPVVIGDFVVVGDLEGYLHALSIEDGSFLARVQASGSAFTSAPVSAGSTLVAQSIDGGISAFELR